MKKETNDLFLEIRKNQLRVELYNSSENSLRRIELLDLLGLKEVTKYTFDTINEITGLQEPFTGNFNTLSQAKKFKRVHGNFWKERNRDLIQRELKTFKSINNEQESI